MNKDPYKRFAGIYNRIFEPMNKGLRVLGFRMHMPPRGGSILDVGCGTGIHLEMYRRFKCSLHGIDASPSMLEEARTRLGEAADLRNTDATRMPYESSSFDLVLCMLVLHEMDDKVRTAVLKEIKRVVKSDGRILLIDYHAGRAKPLQGWFFRIVILLAEIAAGRRHFRGYRHFMSIGGLPSLIERIQLKVEKNQVVGSGNMELYLLSAK